MASQIVTNGGHRSWSLRGDKEGQREFKLKNRVKCDSRDGPSIASRTPGLPVPGAIWAVDNDNDAWAWCTREISVDPVLEGEPNEYFDVENTFSTRAPKKCQDYQVEDPLLEPAEVSGSFVKTMEEATFDRFGNPVRNSAHEQIRGPQVEFDRNRPAVRIKQNVASFASVALSMAMVDNVNNAALWGFARRCIKLSNVTWQRKFHGACHAYYERTLEFDVNPDGFDRNIQDEGTRVLNGHWNNQKSWILDPVDASGTRPNPANPNHFIRYQDWNGNYGRVILDGNGLPAFATVPDVDPIGTGCCDPLSQVLFCRIFGFRNSDLRDNVTQPRGCKTKPPKMARAFTMEWVAAESLFRGFAPRYDDPEPDFPGGWRNFNEGFKFEFACENPGDASGMVLRSTLMSFVDDADVLSPMGRTATAYTNRLVAAVSCEPPVWLFRMRLTDLNNPNNAPGHYQPSGCDCDGDALIVITAARNRVPGVLHLERYPENNFLILGIPLVF